MFGCLGYSRFTDTVRTFNQKRPLLAYKDYTNDMYICCLNQFGTFVLYYCLILRHRFVGYSLDLKVYWFLLLLNLEKNWNIFFQYFVLWHFILATNISSRYFTWKHKGIKFLGNSVTLCSKFWPCKNCFKNVRKNELGDLFYAVPSITLASFVTSLAFLARKRPLSSVS